jgi:hypothetical protein
MAAPDLPISPGLDRIESEINRSKDSIQNSFTRALITANTRGMIVNRSSINKDQSSQKENSTKATTREADASKSVDYFPDDDGSAVATKASTEDSDNSQAGDSKSLEFTLGDKQISFSPGEDAKSVQDKVAANADLFDLVDRVANSEVNSLTDTSGLTVKLGDETLLETDQQGRVTSNTMLPVKLEVLDRLDDTLKTVQQSEQQEAIPVGQVNIAEATEQKTETLFSENRAIDRVSADDKAKQVFTKLLDDKTKVGDRIEGAEGIDLKINDRSILKVDNTGKITEKKVSSWNKEQIEKKLGIGPEVGLNITRTSDLTPAASRWNQVTTKAQEVKNTVNTVKAKAQGVLTKVSKIKADLISKPQFKTNPRSLIKQGQNLFAGLGKDSAIEISPRFFAEVADFRDKLSQQSSPIAVPAAGLAPSGQKPQTTRKKAVVASTKTATTAASSRKKVSKPKEESSSAEGQSL